MITALARALRERQRRAAESEGPDDTSPGFVSGLALGALVGAAIAGSTVWRRLQERARDLPTGPESPSESTAPE